VLPLLTEFHLQIYKLRQQAAVGAISSLAVLFLIIALLYCCVLPIDQTN